MMICKADFEELFPRVTHPGRQRPSAATHFLRPAPCILRWEDEGGRVSGLPPRRAAASCGSEPDRPRPPDPTVAVMALTVLSVMAFHNGASAMLASYRKMIGG